jgi:hypothetical protein
MTDRKIEILTDRVEREFLPFVRRPARYIGGEVNQIRKDLDRCELTVALCFPDVYEVAMSNTGLALMYHVLNSLDGVAAERVFAPWVDAEAILREKSLPLFSLESKASLASFDVIGFGLTNELCYTNVLNMLDLAGLPIRSEQRTQDDPLIIAGGGGQLLRTRCRLHRPVRSGRGRGSHRRVNEPHPRRQEGRQRQGRGPVGGRPAIRLGLRPRLLRICVRRCSYRGL